MSVLFSDIKDGVAANLDLSEIDDNSTPTQDQVAGWVLEATNMMIQLLPDEQLTVFENSYYTGQSVGPSVNLNSAIVRISYVQRGSFSATPLTVEQLARHRRLGLLVHSESRPAYTLSGGPNSLNMNFYPATTESTTIRYIRACDFDPVLWVGSAHGRPPENWLGLLVEYATMKAKYQDEEPEQSEQAAKRWQEKVQIISGRGTLAGRY